MLRIRFFSAEDSVLKQHVYIMYTSTLSPKNVAKDLKSSLYVMFCYVLFFCLSYLSVSSRNPLNMFECPDVLGNM